MDDGISNCVKIVHMDRYRAPGVVRFVVDVDEYEVTKRRIPFGDYGHIVGELVERRANEIIRARELKRTRRGIRVWKRAGKVGELRPLIVLRQVIGFRR